MTPPPGWGPFTVLVCTGALLLAPVSKIEHMLIYSQSGGRVLRGREVLSQLDTDVPCASFLVSPSPSWSCYSGHF